MPIQLPSALIPKGGGSFPLLDDAYIKGGLRVFANIASALTFANTASTKACLKVGCLCVTADTKLLYQYDGTTWNLLAIPPTYHHSQTVSSNVWNIPHNKNCLYFTYTVFVDGLGVILPTDIEAVDANNITVSLPDSYTGNVALVFTL